MLCNLSRVVEEAFRVTRLISSSRNTAAPFEVQPDVPASFASLLLTEGPKPGSHQE